MFKGFSGGSLEKTILRVKEKRGPLPTHNRTLGERTMGGPSDYMLEMQPLTGTALV